MNPPTCVVSTGSAALHFATIAHAFTPAFAGVIAARRRRRGRGRWLRGCAGVGRSILAPCPRLSLPRMAPAPRVATKVTPPSSAPAPAPLPLPRSPPAEAPTSLSAAPFPTEPPASASPSPSPVLSVSLRASRARAVVIRIPIAVRGRRDAPPPGGCNASRTCTAPPDAPPRGPPGPAQLWRATGAYPPQRCHHGGGTGASDARKHGPVDCGEGSHHAMLAYVAHLRVGTGGRGSRRCRAPGCPRVAMTRMAQRWCRCCALAAAQPPPALEVPTSRRGQPAARGAHA